MQELPGAPMLRKTNEWQEIAGDDEIDSAVFCSARKLEWFYCVVIYCLSEICLGQLPEEERGG